MSHPRSLFVTPDGRNRAALFALVSSLFLLWGFCNGLIDLLNKQFQDTLSLSKAESGLVQFAQYIGYFAMALPAGVLARRLGYKGGILAGLGLVALGALWFVPATRIDAYWAFLLGLFVIATGLTCLETIANPYSTLLGAPGAAAFRINLAQMCNGVGWILGPLVGQRFILSGAPATGASANATLYVPYLGIGAVVALLFLVFTLSDVPDLRAPDENPEADAGSAPARSLWSHPHFTGAVAAQFLYVAAQSGIFGFFINYIVSEAPPLSPGAAARLPAAWVAAGGDGAWRIVKGGAPTLLSAAFGCFLAGRFAGSLALRRFRADRLLGSFAAASAALMVFMVLPLGWLSVTALFGSFFFMSVMYPTIFALGIDRLGPHTKSAASFIVMAIVGGALMPPLMGWLADRWSMRVGFLLPLGCFLCVALYAFAWTRLSGAKEIRLATPVAH